ncbi:hypothetical protein K3495_g4465 [Podosphaera aphanis]|nr:hypothetical protein K3495_g4465 [Podosphaera aphanis]
MSSRTVHVKNISPETSDKEVKDFFSFCGKLAEISISKSDDNTQNAVVTFEKDTAARTALLLDNTQLGANKVQISGETVPESEGAHPKTNNEKDSDEITQEEKPRSRIVAEYLAHGYVLGDQTLQRAIDLDNKHGVTNRFLSTLQKLDSKYQATEKAKSVDQSYGVTPKVNNFLSGLSSYYEKAAGTPSGKKLVNFYSQTSRQVLDIHNEALRLASLKKETAAAATPSAGQTNTRCNVQTETPSKSSKTTSTSSVNPEEVNPKSEKQGLA